ncbi:DUF92 domain-containing protein [Pyrococcus furiosus DSM 3638]|uniref:DUF92 domain-containing protein n=3 Tax=Pyrococcus furiosus TaxID=2261 RepID=A0A5C0XUG5_PYRFU|nr:MULTISPECIES: DUF92 domain-containing protein [Pyrococcus]AAL82053.1 hypothetical protein PF1929 [Pyrococcus furiosus DSM 3638]AFN04710.1 hypothetical protein PFC_08935 [Pyrococcus furiosus COM1]MDK2869406.1 hypothetical protein [Pyrococcus sp.]QEK79524.1 DUF92 domain-containing protein [Pyrococcus furiosus DSM 3638]
MWAYLAILAMAYVTYKTKALDIKGIIAALLLGVIIVTLGGIIPFIALLAFLVMGTLATKFRYREKRKMGLIDESIRSVGNVLGNGLAPLLFVIVEFIIKQDFGWAGVLSSIAVANADTLASEIGKVFGKNPRIITNLKPAKPGEEGAVSFAGEFAALLGAFVISLFGLSLTEYGIQMIVSVTLAGLIGANIDSLIGATFEKNGYFGNNMTNFIATLLGGLLGMALFLLLV